MHKESISISDVSVKFKLEINKINTLKEFFVATMTKKLKYEEFLALNDVSFQVNKGEVLGVIGRNGSGKSTLLKVVSGILKPTTGIVKTNGNIVPMLELGAGFDAELSGIENIYLNGAILGYSKSFLDQKYEEILAFSELEKFIEVPIRSYSSGMMMRLAFSIATMVNPEILIVDEILAVGDANFQEKSYKRMMELMSGGTTVLFVSHSLNQIREMCDRVLWLDHGKVRAIGLTKDVCDEYEQYLNTL